MKTDVEISEATKILPVQSIADKLGISANLIEPYGNSKAKLSLEIMKRPEQGKLILVTAINPTPAGEGKTTVNIGLSMALNRLGVSAVSALREPSLGPCFGMKGGATGGGYAQVVPMDDINLHFTGDFHAITSAHNLLAALIDNHIYHGNEMGIDPERLVWHRVMDMNDRSLRELEIVGKRVSHATSFDITVASEIMAILCLAEDMDDLKQRLSRIVVGYTFEGEMLTAQDFDAVGAMALLLKDAIKPNLVQTTENTPALIHGGPFANIAHGCNSVIATRMALKVSDYVVTEAGFGADLGAEKFYDIKCRGANLVPDATVLVATIRALKYNGGVPLSELEDENIAALMEGSKNLIQHYENLKQFSDNVMIAINQFETDTQEEINYLKHLGQELGCEVVLTNVFARGGEGGEALGRAVIEMCQRPSNFKPLYPLTQNLRQEIETIAHRIYRADSVSYSESALEKLKDIESQYPDGLPVCIAKTQTSFSDDPKKLNAPANFSVHVRDVRLAAGAGFVVVLLGNILTMPGLPKHPNAVDMDYIDGKVTGLR
ncbi:MULTISPECIES: formate--tetrahydrofolate ligase [unclassified Erysipelothrix]|uniref:formate--tetrahydrofolate ligase n=1 Tax=unclassified Erysipelothrix TaxID=2624170 RepID=UPI001378B0BC|nr:MULTISPECIES: formate--tetrahydrofolate ligase [unclassified Erysipelothrix]MBK2402652.1 formate--tetrahydrofolate ligase [Erysipelothrix sp. strain 2 (EsS2-6-Brazil)]MBK2403702.1 formate--tetrahydrofolate ligase [Erysipelothrix sp. strain 2 (EsS2-7-Brazil)]NBA01440.1 formate--tetrahydrofolate ligase [Erysipelothrix rhusiopathiae]